VDKPSTYIRQFINKTASAKRLIKAFKRGKNINIRHTAEVIHITTTVIIIIKPNIKIRRSI